VKYPFEKLFLVCTGERCNKDKAGEEIRGALKDLNKKLGRKPTVRICAVSCLDLCDYGPNIVVEPGGTTYSHLSLRNALDVYRGEMGDGPQQPQYELDERDLKR
jgi:NADH:ubiquinone oxidoreductase subunit E